MPDHDIAESMTEALENDPDAAVLVTIDDAEGDREENTGVWLYADNSDRDDILRRLVALRAGALLASHFPNEAKSGVARVTGGRASYDGTFRDPERDWERYCDPDRDDPPTPEGAADGTGAGT